MGDEKKTERKRCFFIDYENVNKKGLRGMELLAEGDYVFIYYSEAADTLTFEQHQQIHASAAQFSYIRLDWKIKNGMDCRILFDFDQQAKANRKNEYYIISKDQDYDEDIRRYTAQKIKIKRAEDIGTAIQEAPPAALPVKPSEEKTEPANPKNEKKTPPQDEKKHREAQVRSFFGQHFKKAVYKEHKEEIIGVVLESRTRIEVNNALMKLFPNDIVKEVYKKLQPLIKELPGN